MRHAVLRLAAVTALMMLFGQTSKAGFAVFTGSANSLSAEADFNASGGTLTVTLTNTSTSSVSVPNDVLTAVFFNYDGTPGLSAINGSAAVASGSSVINVSGTPPTDVSGEWAYKGGISTGSLPSFGISSTGLGIFGPGDVFPGSNLAGPPSGDPDGLQYGIASASTASGTGNPNVSITPLINNSVIFTFTSAANFDVSKIQNVTFFYGTGIGDVAPFPGGQGPNPVPAPPTAILALMVLPGFVAMAWSRRRRVVMA